MANIDVVKKRSSMSIWMIVLIILAIALIAWFAMRGGSASSVGPTSELTNPSLAALAMV